MSDIKEVTKKIERDRYAWLQWWSEIIETSAKNDVVSVATSKVKLFLKAIW